jgi:hypothetical protein
MREWGRMIISLVEDRGQPKWRVNFIKEERIWGFLKPVGERRWNKPHRGVW